MSICGPNAEDRARSQLRAKPSTRALGLSRGRMQYEVQDATTAEAPVEHRCPLDVVQAVLRILMLHPLLARDPVAVRPLERGALEYNRNSWKP